MTGDMEKIVHEVFGNWYPFPSEPYCRRMGWDINKDGTVEAPGGCFPTRESCEVRELERLYGL